MPKKSKKLNEEISKDLKNPKEELKIEIINKKKPVVSGDGEETELESLIDEETFDYPLFLRRASPSLRARPISSEPLEIELEDLPSPKQQENDEAPGRGGEYINQKYELYKSANYDVPGYPKTAIQGSQDFSPQSQFAPAFTQSASLTPSDSSAASGYSGQSGERQYYSGLEEQSKKEKKNAMW